MTKSKKSTKQVERARLAEEIADGRLAVKVSMQRAPVALEDVIAGRWQPFQPSTWRAPNWRRYGAAELDSSTGTTAFVCDDPIQQVFAIEAMKVAYFVLPDFDLWLDALEASPARDELARRRDWLCDAIAENDTVAIVKHCEFMRTQRVAVERALAVRPMIERDAKLQASKHKPRGSRMPKLDAWLDEHLRDEPLASSDSLFAALMRKGDDDDDLYVDGEKIVEVNRQGREHAIGRDGLEKRVTAARKRRL